MDLFFGNYFLFYMDGCRKHGIGEFLDTDHMKGHFLVAEVDEVDDMDSL